MSARQCTSTLWVLAVVGLTTSCAGTSPHVPLLCTATKAANEQLLAAHRQAVQAGQFLG